jgi:hypothetical protein
LFYVLCCWPRLSLKDFRRFLLLYAKCIRRQLAPQILTYHAPIPFPEPFCKDRQSSHLLSRISQVYPLTNTYSIIDDNHVGSAPKTPEPLKDSATLGFGPVPCCCVQYDGHSWPTLFPYTLLISDNFYVFFRQPRSKR